MKKFCLTTAIAVFLLICLNGLQAQTTQTKLNQVELAKQIVGTWQRNISKDTIEVWETQLYGKAIIHTGFLIINGEKSFDYMDSYCYSSKEDKFKGFMVNTSGYNTTWIGSFTSDKKLVGDFVRDFNPEAVTGKFELVIETPTSTTYSIFDAKGVKTKEFKYAKTK
jgi:hypothetical protein